MRTRRLLAMASTYPTPRCSRVSRRVGSAPYTSSPATHAPDPASSAAVIIAVARAGLVANPCLVRDAGGGAPLGVVHPRLRQVQRAVDQRVPVGAAYARYTATWEFSIRPAVPVYWRCTPTVWAALLQVAGLVHHQHRVRIAEVVDDVAAQVVTDPSASHTARDSKCCNPSGVRRRDARRSTSSSSGPDRTTTRASTRRRAGAVRAG